MTQTEKREWLYLLVLGTATINAEGIFEVEENDRLPDFAAALPATAPQASVVVERDKLLQALAGQDKHVRLAFFGEDMSVELSSAGAYALVMPISGLEEEAFWRPGIIMNLK